MFKFESFTLSGDRFYQVETFLPLDQQGLTLLRGKNYDGSSDGKYTSNGSGKTRLFSDLLLGFIYNRSPRGTFKKVTTSTFNGTLIGIDNKGDRYSFTFNPSTSKAWTITKNDMPIKVSHKSTDCQEMLQKIIGLSRDDFNHYVFLTQSGLDILIKGKPLEKKNFLEVFFNIDSFYSQKFDFYNNKWKKIKDDIEVIRSDRIKLDALTESRRELAGEKWIEFQIENCDSALTLIKEQILETQNEQELINKQISIWKEYHQLFTKLQGIDAESLKKEQDILVKTKIELEQKAKNKLTLENFVRTKLKPHRQKKPILAKEKPDQSQPEHKLIVEKEIAITQMREKLRLKKQISSLNKQMEQIEFSLDGTIDDLEKQRIELLTQKAEVIEHLNIIKLGSDICPTCKQPLSFILKGMTREERKLTIEKTLHTILIKEKEISQNLAKHSEISKLKQEHFILSEEFNRFPTFGLRLSEAEVELTNLKSLFSDWEVYNKEQDQFERWKNTDSLLLAEATNLGYPDILSEDHSGELYQISNRLPSVQDDLKLFDRFDSLTEIVLLQKPLPELESKNVSLKDALSLLLTRVENLNEFKGNLRSQLSSHSFLKTQIDLLEVKVAKMAETESECKILNLLNDFYASTGFKVYELKRRCQKLIDRANIWSNQFFQEKYKWTLSDNMDNLDFFVQPVNDPETVPYPISGLSSGEYNRASRVLLFSQLELIPPNKNTNLLILDEIESNLDEAGLTAFMEDVLPKLKETFPDKTIIIISHQTSLQQSEHIDHLWLVERKNRKSKLTVFKDYKRKKG